MSSFGDKIIGGAIWTAFETWGRQIAVFVVFVLLAHQVGPEELGLAALAMVVPVVLGVPITHGLPDAIIQRAELLSIHLNSAFWFLVASGLFLFGFIWVGSGIVAYGFDQPALTELVEWSAAVVIFHSIAAIPGAYLRRNLEFRLLALRTLAGTVISGLLGIALAYQGYGAWALVWMNLAKAAIETAIIVIGSSWKPRLRFSLARVHDLSGFAVPLVIQSLWTFVNDEIPKVVIGAVLGPPAVGMYVFARRPLDLLSEALLNPVVAVTLPAVARFQSQPDKIDHFFNTAIRMAGLIGFPTFVGFAAVAPVAVPLIFGDQWTSGVLATQLLMIIGLQRVVDNVCAFSILALGHSRILLRLNIVYTALSLALIPASAAQGFEMAIAALVICNVSFVPIFLILVQKNAKIDVLRPLMILPRLALASALMFAGVTAWFQVLPSGLPPLVALAGGVALGACIYLSGILYLVRPDLLIARNLLLRMRN